MSAVEVNFDGLVGPTHNYSGLSYGNVASLRNLHAESNPREAAKQGLHKMKALHDMGVPQAVLPPHERPDVGMLRRLGFAGSDKAVIEQAYRQAPPILHACSSASAMWTANAATVSPSADTADNRVHFTPANLVDKFHRAIEPATTGRVLNAIFADERFFAHHPPLPAVSAFGDEGAANHTRLCSEYGESGIELFVYGRRAFAEGPKPLRYPARHTLEASQTVSRLHGLNSARVVFAQQNPEVIDAGVFHNDVIAVGNRNVFFFHEAAFINGALLKADVRERFGNALFYFIEVSASEVSVEDAVDSYLFNSQLVSLANGQMALILPRECQERDTVWRYLQSVRESDNPICRLEVLDLRQSMRNGGGPACLRLRVVLNNEELAALNPSVRFDETLLAALNTWIDKHYRDRLNAADLGDPQLLDESRIALDELSGILNLGSVYPFQLV